MLAKGGGKSQYPKWFKGRKTLAPQTLWKAVSEKHIVWTYGASRPDGGSPTQPLQYMSAAIEMIYTLPEVQRVPNIKAFENKLWKELEKGNIMTDVKFKGKTTGSDSSIMHVPSATESPILKETGSKMVWKFGIVEVTFVSWKPMTVYAKPHSVETFIPSKMKVVPVEKASNRLQWKEMYHCRLPTWHRWMVTSADTALRSSLPAEPQGMEVQTHTSTGLRGLC